AHDSMPVWSSAHTNSADEPPIAIWRMPSNADSLAGIVRCALSTSRPQHDVPPVVGTPHSASAPVETSAVQPTPPGPGTVRAAGPPCEVPSWPALLSPQHVTVAPSFEHVWL